MVIATIVTTNQNAVVNSQVITASPESMSAATGVLVESVQPVNVTILSASPPPPFSPVTINDGVLQGGHTAKADQFPYMTYIRAEHGNFYALCSGTLIGTMSKPFVLTAKHCVDSKQMTDLKIYGCGPLDRRFLTNELTLYGEGLKPDVAYLYSSTTPASPNEMYTLVKRDIVLIPIRLPLPTCIAAESFAKVTTKDIVKSQKVQLVGYGYDQLDLNWNPIGTGVLQYINDLDIQAVTNRIYQIWKDVGSGMYYEYGQDIKMNSASQGIRGGFRWTNDTMRYSNTHHNMSCVGVASYESINENGQNVFSGHVGISDFSVRNWIQSVLNLDNTKHQSTNPLNGGH